MSVTSLKPSGLLLSQQRSRHWQLRLFVATCFAWATSTSAYAQLAEAENSVNWVLSIFSPNLLLALLTLLLLGCGLAWWLGYMRGSLFIRILGGSLLVFGARSIAPRIMAIFGG